MRLTLPLRFPQNMRRLKDYSWHRWRKTIVKDDGLEQELRAAGFEVIDANEFVRQDSPEYVPIDSLPEPEPLFPQPPKENYTHPNWHDRPCKLFKNDCFPVEGIPQAESFTKSVQFKKGLPDNILELGNINSLDDQDTLVQKVIKHAFLWDAQLEKYKKLRDLEIPTFSFGAYYGILPQRSNLLMIRNLLRLCEMQFPMDGQRVIGREEEFRVNLERHGNPVQFKFDLTASILSKNPLKPISDPSLTLDKKVKDIYPFNSVANFEEVNIYDDGDFSVYKPDCPFPFIQTAFVSHHIWGSHTHVLPRWTNERFSGTSVLINFAASLLMARQKYGPDVKELPEPITTQAVHFTGKEFQFSVFQLNTLDLENTDKGSVKNNLWLTDKINIFEECKFDSARGVLNGYNPEVFKMLMGMYAIGVN